MKPRTTTTILLTPPAQRLTEQQLRAALGVIEDTDPRLLAIHQLLNDELQDAILHASSPHQSPSLGTHAGGRIDALLAIKSRLATLRNIS